MDIFDPITPELANPEKSAEPKKITLKDYRVFNKNFVTRVLPTVAYCGHKVDPEIAPTTNCECCWLAFFNSNNERVEEWSKLLNEGKEQEIVDYYGIKYLKWFKKFLISVHALRMNGKE